MKLREFLDRIPGEKRQFRAPDTKAVFYRAPCPCHEDDATSLAVSVKQGRILTKCEVCGAREEQVRIALALEEVDFYADLKGPTAAYDVDEVPLYSLEAEMSALGAAMLSHEAAKKMLQDLSARMFYREAHRKLYLAMQEVVAAGREVDFVTVRDRLSAHNHLGAIGGEDYLLKIAEYTPSAANAAYYNSIVVEKYARRTMEERLRLAIRSVRNGKAYSDVTEECRAIASGLPMPGGAGAIRTVGASSVVPLEVEWLWEPYIPLGMITMLEGDPDVGKSFLTCAVAAAISKGHPMPPHRFQPKVGRVLMFATEDDVQRTIVPRLIRQDADLEKITVVEDSFPFDRKGLGDLERSIAADGSSLVILDPLMSFVKSALNKPRSDVDERFIMDELKAVAQRTNCALLCIRHLRKESKETNMMYSGVGSIDIVAAARSALAVRYHPEQKGLRVVTHYKGNLAPKGDSFGYEIRDGAVLYTGALEMTPEDFTQQAPRPGEDTKGAIEAAKAFLQEVLEGGGYVKSEDVFEQAKAVGIKSRTLYRAKDALGARATKAGFGDGFWRWYLPEKETPEEDSSDGEYDPFAGLD